MFLNHDSPSPKIENVIGRCGHKLTGKLAEVLDSVNASDVWRWPQRCFMFKPSSLELNNLEPSLSSHSLRVVSGLILKVTFDVSIYLQRDDEGEARDENDDTELNKRLNKQRQRAIASASGGRKGRASRNTYKDKGRKSSNNSKIHKQIGLW